jgi:hypothetical protein
MASSLNAPKVFISYSWKPTVNKQKTIALAERMVNDGVNVILDVWNLAEGQDKYQFMEQMVNDPEIKRVLMICNKDYKEKADQKKGGVGTESLIISDKIYKQSDQKKFVPIIFERDGNGEAYVPTFIHSRIYIDLSSDENFEDEYEKLLRNIFDKPASKKPPIGTPPAYIQEDEPTFLRTAHKVKTIQNALINEKRNSQVFVDDYYSTFIQALSDFEIKIEEIKSPQYIDELVLKKIEEMKALRNDFINFLETIFTYSAEFNLDKFISFLEKLLEFLMTSDGINHPSDTLGYLKLDHYRFFLYELFLYITAVLIEKEKFKELGAILHTSFVIFNKETSKTEAFSFPLFNQYAKSLDKYRNERLQMNRASVTADIIKQRADNPKYTFDKIREYDVLLYYIDIMTNETEHAWLWFRWFPQTTVYHIYNLLILEKLISQRHFEKLKPLFDVNTIDELKQKIEKVITIKADKIQRFNHYLPYINQAFDFAKIGTVK